MSNSDAKLISGFSAPSKSLTDTERSEYQSFICYVQYSRTICILITDDLECPLDLNIVGVISNVDEVRWKTSAITRKSLAKRVLLPTLDHFSRYIATQRSNTCIL